MSDFLRIGVKSIQKPSETDESRCEKNHKKGKEKQEITGKEEFLITKDNSFAKTFKHKVLKGIYFGLMAPDQGNNFL